MGDAAAIPKGGPAVLDDKVAARFAVRMASRKRKPLQGCSAKALSAGALFTSSFSLFFLQ